MYIDLFLQLIYYVICISFWRKSYFKPLSLECNCSKIQFVITKAIHCASFFKIKEIQSGFLYAWLAIKKKIFLMICTNDGFIYIFAGLHTENRA